MVNRPRRLDLHFEVLFLLILVFSEQVYGFKMTFLDDFISSKNFDHFIPNLLKDAEVLIVLQNEFKIPKGEEEKFNGELKDEVHDFLEQYILENAPEIEGVEVNLNDDPEETEYGIYTYRIRGMKGVFFTESADDDTCYFPNYKTARSSIELNHNVVLNDVISSEDSKVDKSLASRISEAEKMIFDDHLFGTRKY